MSSIQEILVLHHSHTDIGFTHPQPVLWELQNRFINRALDLLEQTSDWPEDSKPRWTCETTAPVLHWLRSASKKQKDRFLKLAESDRVGIGAMFCHFTPLVSVDELARSLQPVRDLRAEFGLPIKVAIVHDVNGLPWPAAQLLLDAGVEMLLMGLNVHFGGYPLTRPLGFRWGTSDGRSLLTFNGEHYQGFDRVFRLAKGTLEEMHSGYEAYSAGLARAGYAYDFVFLTASHHTFADNNPPNRATADLIRQWNEDGRGPRIRYVTPEMFLARMQGLPDLGLHTGGWDDFWSFGVGNAARETSVSRQTRTRLNTAELLAHTQGRHTPGERARFDEAWRNVLLFDEHTFGSCMAVEHPEFDDCSTQWYLKAAYAYTARGLTTLLLRDRLELLSRNPVEANGLGGVLLLNPSCVPRTFWIRVPTDWQSGKWDHILSNVQLMELVREKCEAGEGVLVGPIELPAYGFRVIPVADLTPARPATDVTAEEGAIESPFYRVEFAPDPGKILSILDKRSGRQLIDPASAWSFFGYVQETIAGQGTRDAFYEFDWDKIPAGIPCWRSDWPGQRIGPTSPSCKTEITPEGVSLIITWGEAPGADNLVQKITLPSHRPAILLSASFHKQDLSRPEGIYFTFPLTLPGWKAHFDPAGIPVEFDSELLPGTCRDYSTVGQWAAIHNQDQCLTLACPDAPLLQIGGFHFAKVQKSVTRDPNPLLLAWPMNNYWNVNFRSPGQPGPITFRYELTTSSSFDAAECTRASAHASVPIEMHPVIKPSRRQEGRLLEIKGDGIFLKSFRAAADGTAVIAMLVNVSTQNSTGHLTIPGRELVSAEFCGTLEEPTAPLPVLNRSTEFTLPPRSVRTLRLACRK